MSRTLSLYIYRATLGLPREERREVAAELRSHLLDRVRQLEAEGFEREEAEHLAVRAMGSPKATNSELLGHFFTTPLGWAVAALTALGLGGYWAWQNVPLPLLGQPWVKWEDKLSTDDLAFLMEREEAPRAPYEAVTLSIPAKTKWFYIAVLPHKGNGQAILCAQLLADTLKRGELSPNQTLKARFLLSGKLWEDRICPIGKNGEKQLQVYVELRPLLGDLRGELQTNGTNTCTSLTFPKDARWSGWSSNWIRHSQTRQPLKQNEWTVLAAYEVNLFLTNQAQKKGIGRSWPASENAVDYLLAVMPADRPLHTPDPRQLPEAARHGFGLFTSGPSWEKDARGLPRPTLKP